jgi:hypothetical protein
MDDRAYIRMTEKGRGKKILVLILALIVVAIVIGTVARGFRTQPWRSAGASSPMPTQLSLLASHR